MAETTVKAVFQGMMEQIRKSRYPLAPLYEAIANSLEAILQKDFGPKEEPAIKLTFEFRGLLLEHKTLSRIVIEDNGIGFDRTNFSRFETLLDKSKGYNNRGSGRIQFVHRFGRVDVTSFYSEDAKHFKRTFPAPAPGLCTINTLSRIVRMLRRGQRFHSLLRTRLAATRNILIIFLFMKLYAI